MHGPRGAAKLAVTQRKLGRTIACACERSRAKSILVAQAHGAMRGDTVEALPRSGGRRGGRVRELEVTWHRSQPSLVGPLLRCATKCCLLVQNALHAPPLLTMPPSRQSHARSLWNEFRSAHLGICIMICPFLKPPARAVYTPARNHPITQQGGALLRAAAWAPPPQRAAASCA